MKQLLSRPVLIMLFAIGLVTLLMLIRQPDDPVPTAGSAEQAAATAVTATAPRPGKPAGVLSDAPLTAPGTDNLQPTTPAALPDAGDLFTGDLDQMRKRKQIRALVTYSRTDFFFYKGRAKGLQVEFLQAYEKFLNKGITKPEDRVHISFLPVTFDQLIPALNEGRGDIAAAFLTITPQREEQVRFATGGRFRVNELVVSNPGKVTLERLEDLSGKRVYVLSNSSYAEHLETLNGKFRQQGLEPVDIIHADSKLLSEDILEMVDSGVVDITVIDDYRARVWQPLLPNLKIHENLVLSGDNSIGWAVRHNNPQLAGSLDDFALKVRKGTLLGNMLFRRYYSDSDWLKNPTSKKELVKLRQSIDLFRKYGDRYGFDYLALLAQAYQESGLDNNKKSHRGAVGIMQILPSTAKDSNVRISNIRVLENNIHAGTRYLAFLRDRYFSDPAITPENRQAFTWAAYNAGPANVIRMRKKAAAMGLDPNVWFSNVEIAASKLVGRETVQYVAHIHKYYIAYKLASQLHSEDGEFISRVTPGKLRYTPHCRSVSGAPAITNRKTGFCHADRLS